MSVATLPDLPHARFLPFGAHPVAWLACLAIALLMVFPAVSGAILAGLALWGIGALLREGRVTRGEGQFVLICCLLPASVAFNMAQTGWAFNLLDRPMHLVYAAFVALLLARRGLGLRAFVAAVIIAAMASGAVALIEGVALDHGRVHGLDGRWNAVPFGNFALLLGCLGLAGGLVLGQDARHGRAWLLAGVAALGCAGIASVLSSTRGGWITLPVLLLLATVARRDFRAATRLGLVAGVLALAATGYHLSPQVQSRVGDAIANVSRFIDAPDALDSMTNATGIRLAMWRWGLDRFRESPWQGVGYANYAERRAASVERGELPDHFNELANLHNELISSLAFAGLPGGLALITFWALALRFFASRLDRGEDPATRFFATAGLLVVVGTALFSMTEGLLGTRSGTYGMALLLALPAAALLARERGLRAEPAP